MVSVFLQFFPGLFVYFTTAQKGGKGPDQSLLSFILQNDALPCSSWLNFDAEHLLASNWFQTSIRGINRNHWVQHTLPAPGLGLLFPTSAGIPLPLIFLIKYFEDSDILTAYLPLSLILFFFFFFKSLNLLVFEWTFSLCKIPLPSWLLLFGLRGLLEPTLAFISILANISLFALRWGCQIGT